MDIYHIMSSTLNILLNISEIAIITGDNTFKSKRDYLLDFWKKNKKDDFSKYQKLAKFVSKDTDEEVIKKIAIKNNIDIKLLYYLKMKKKILRNLSLMSRIQNLVLKMNTMYLKFTKNVSAKS